MRRLTVEIGILRRRAASEKLAGFDDLREQRQRVEIRHRLSELHE